MQGRRRRQGDPGTAIACCATVGMIAVYLLVVSAAWPHLRDDDPGKVLWPLRLFIQRQPRRYHARHAARN